MSSSVHTIDYDITASIYKKLYFRLFVKTSWFEKLPFELVLHIFGFDGRLGWRCPRRGSKGYIVGKISLYDIRRDLVMKALSYIIINNSPVSSQEIIENEVFIGNMYGYPLILYASWRLIPHSNGFIRINSLRFYFKNGYL